MSSKAPLQHPVVISPREHAEWRSDKMGKSTIFESSRILVGLNAFEPGQAHPLHAHAGMDKVYHVLDGRGLFLLDGRELPMQAGDLLVADSGNNTIRTDRVVAPVLEFNVLGDQLSLRWPASSINFRLETASAPFAGEAWVSLTNGVTINGDSFVLDKNVSEGGGFFRLHQR